MTSSLSVLASVFVFVCRLYPSRYGGCSLFLTAYLFVYLIKPSAGGSLFSKALDCETSLYPGGCVLLLGLHEASTAVAPSTGDLLVADVARCLAVPDFDEALQ